MLQIGAEGLHGKTAILAYATMLYLSNFFRLYLAISQFIDAVYLDEICVSGVCAEQIA